jgi:hypothetical protein
VTSAAGVDRAPYLFGRDDVIRELRRLMAAHRSVLLVGPSAVGKSALVRAAVEGEGESADVIDPFEAISSRRAAEIRRRMDKGASVLAASRTLERRSLGAVGRILWRFDVVRVRPLSTTEMTQLIVARFGAAARSARGLDAWARDVSRASRGLPGWGRAFGDAGLSYWRRRGQLPTREWTVVEGLAALSATASAACGDRT